MSKALGKGLSALFGEETMLKSSISETSDLLFIDILRIEPNKGQPRKVFDEKLLSELADSIKKHGVLTPIAVTPQAGGMYQIIAGERRWRASRLANLDKIPAFIIDADKRQVMELAMIENLQRQDLNAVEEAQGYYILMEEFGLTQDQVSENVSKSRSAIANSLRLLALDNEILSLISDGIISSGHGRAILSLNDNNRHLEFVKKIIDGKLSVRSAEALAKTFNKTKTQTLTNNNISIYIKNIEEKLESTLGRKIKISYNSNNKGKIELEYYNSDDLELLVNNLSKMDL